MHEFLEGLLRHKSDMVNIEAARAICDMKNVTASDLVRPVAGEYPGSTLVPRYQG
jgi:coatomer protein complex subunit gamma